MKFLLPSILLALTGLAAQAATINWANGGGRGHMFTTSDTSDRVDAGNLVRIGYFETAGDINSAFIEFGTTTVGDPGAAPNNIGGHIPAAGKAINNTTAEGNSLFASKQLVIWVYNASTAAAATEQGIFTSTAWTTPGNFNANDQSFVVTLGNSTAPAFGPVTALFGSYSTGAVTVAGTANQSGSIYTLAAIPEASTFTVSLLGLGLLCARRRR